MIKVLEGETTHEIPVPDVKEAYTLAVNGVKSPLGPSNVICISRRPGESSVRVVVRAPAPQKSVTRIFDLSTQDESYRVKFFDALRSGIAHDDWA